MKFERKHALFLLGVAVWNVVTYAQFSRALITTTEDRPTGYYVAHTILIIVNVLIAGVLGRWGWQAWKANRESESSTSERVDA